jgi:hypothetical protein
MDENGSSYNPPNLASISPTLGLLTQLEERKLIKGRIVLILVDTNNKDKNKLEIF